MIKKLIKISRQVIKDSAIENGAIVAANTDKKYYPRTAADYRWVWPRDSSFICLAADILKIKIQEPFFEWLKERPEDFIKEKKLYGNYSTNGRRGSMGGQFQPDQMGTVLWIIHYYFRKNLKKALKYKELIKLTADGLTEAWNKTYFFPNTFDIWEDSNRGTSTKVENNHTYSLAACSRGLLCAYEIIPIDPWKETALQMKKEIEEAYNKKKGYFYRNYGKISDANVDASLLGLVWPFKIYQADDHKITKTVEKIEKTLVINGGVHRYQFDYYDSEGSAQEGGGAWPLLNFWMSIYWSIRGDKNKAFQYYNWVIQRAKKHNGYFPEQIFDDFREGVYPLVWSHAMFIIASKYLGYIK